MDEVHVTLYLQAAKASYILATSELNKSILPNRAASLQFDPTLPPRDPDEQSYKEVVAQDPITLCCGTVHAIRASGQQHNNFDEIISNGNAKGWFKEPKDANKIIKIPQVQLLHDMKVRWDSMYYMICQFHEMHPWQMTG
jgi:hypothetical protein